jgi:hypothetical protein
MARRSILSSVRDQQRAGAATVTETPPRGTSTATSSRRFKLHIGGYFDPDDQTIVAFQKLKVDLRKSQQEMLLEALRDFVAKQQAERAFR